MARTRWRWPAVALLAVLSAGGLTGCPEDKGCTIVASAFDPQAWPYQTAEAAIEAFMASPLPDTPVPAGAKFEYARTIPETASSLEVAEFREVDGPGKLGVQHDRAGGWAVASFETCRNT